MANAGAYFKQQFSAALGALKSITPVAAASWTMVAVLFVSVPAMCGAAQKLLARAGCVTKVNALGIELTISADDVKNRVFPFNPNLENHVAAKVADAVSALEPEEYVRLMEVGELTGLCEYDKPTAKMRRDVALDYGLEEKKLVKIDPDPVALSEGRKRTLDIGHPLSCYKMTLTNDLGRDVKTVLVQSVKDAFAAPRGHVEPAPDANKVAAR
jgi:hypothetical protein